MQYSSEYFEPVRKGNFTAQGFVGIYKKAGSHLGGQQVMCFIKRGSLVGSWFLWQQIAAFRKKEILVGDFFADRKLFSEKEIVSDENAKFQTFCTQKYFG